MLEARSLADYFSAGGDGDGGDEGVAVKPSRNLFCLAFPFVRVGFLFSHFSTGLVAGVFLFSFVGKSAQKNPPGKSPAESSKIYTIKIPHTFLQRGRPLLLRNFLSEIGL